MCTDVTADLLQMEDKVAKCVADARREWRGKEKKHREQSEAKIRELSKLVLEVDGKVETDNWQLKQVMAAGVATTRHPSLSRPLCL